MASEQTGHPYSEPIYSPSYLSPRMAPVPPAEERSFAYENYGRCYTPQSNDPSLYQHEFEQDSNRESREPSKAKPNSPAFSEYKPTALRWWFHLGLIVCLATAIGLTQYAIDSLGMPHALPGELLSNVTAARRVQDSSREAAQGLDQRSTQHSVELFSSQDKDAEDPNGSVVQSGHLDVQSIVAPKEEPLEEDMAVLKKQTRHLPRAELASTKQSTSDLSFEQLSTASSPSEGLGNEQSNNTLSNDNVREGGNNSTMSSSSNATVGDDTGENSGSTSGSGSQREPQSEPKSKHIIIGKYKFHFPRDKSTGMGSLVDITAGIEEPTRTWKAERLLQQDQAAELPPGEPANLDERQANIDPNRQEESGLLEFDSLLGKYAKSGTSSVSTAPATHNGWQETVRVRKRGGGFTEFLV